MPPAIAAAAISVGGSLIGGAINRGAQNRAAERAQQTSAKDFAFFSDPLMRFGEQSAGYGKQFLGEGQRYGAEADRLFGGAESKFEDLYGQLDQNMFNSMSNANLQSSLIQAAPAVGNLLGAVSGRGFNPSRSGGGASQLGGLYQNILQEHGRYQTGLQSQLINQRAGLAGQIAGLGSAREAQRRYATDTGIGFRGEQGSILEAMLSGAPPGSEEYFTRGADGSLSVNTASGGGVETRGARDKRAAREQLTGILSKIKGPGRGRITPGIGTLVAAGRFR